MHEIEEMSAFFTARVDGYDAHMLTNIEGLPEAYARVAALVPDGARALLDLGCGTGLELAPIFARQPDIAVTGIDLTRAMLDALAAKYQGRSLTLIQGSYFDVDFGEAAFDVALSFETLHHFTHDEKRGLYRRVHRALRPGGVYIEADYMAATQDEEDAAFAEWDALLAAMGRPDGFFHYDTPCTVSNQRRVLREAGFSRVREAWRRAGTSILVADW